MLSQYLAKFREIAQQQLEARQLAQSTEVIEASLLLHLLAYTGVVRNRALLLTAAGPVTDEQQVLALHLRLSVVETLVAFRYGKVSEPQEAQSATKPTSLHALLQRLVSAESRLFHLFGVAPLN